MAGHGLLLIPGKRHWQALMMTYLEEGSAPSISPDADQLTLSRDRLRDPSRHSIRIITTYAWAPGFCDCYATQQD